MSRRNETVYGTKTVIGKQAGAVTTTGDDAKTFQAVMIEFSKDQPAAKVHFYTNLWCHIMNVKNWAFVVPSFGCCWVQSTIYVHNLP